MYILGIYNSHNSTAALLKDGKVIACASEERFIGVKNFHGFPKKAIEYCLKEAGISSSDLDLVTVPYKYGAPLHSFQESKDAVLSVMVLIYKVANIVRKIWGELAYKFPFLMPIGQLFFRIATLTFGFFHMPQERKYIAKYLGLSSDKVVFMDHHLSHAASAYYCSPFNQEKALVLTIDGEGDFNSATAYIFEKDKYKVLATSPRESSIGYIYSVLTEFLGMKAREHEYKVMGLAPYAKGPDIEKTYEKIKDIVFLDPKNPLVFKSKFNTLDTLKFLERNLKRVRFDFLAAAFQKLVEEKLAEWTAAAIKETGLNTVVLSGGVAMNVKANQKIVNMPQVKKFFVMPSAGDESSPIGSSFLGYLHLKNTDFIKNSTITDIYWGPQFSESDIEEALNDLDKKKYKIKKVKNIEEETAKLLSQNEVVAVCSGRMEFGARALGNRSILANPSNPKAVRIINDQIKGRDFWMPFAPSIAWDYMDEYIENPKKVFSPYMMVSTDSTEKAQKELPAAMHQYDFTVRPQMLKEDYNPRYYKIIKHFRKLTGIGGVLNTSFNLHGFPIVLGPKEAIYTLEHSGLQNLVLENYIVSKVK